MASRTTLTPDQEKLLALANEVAKQLRTGVFNPEAFLPAAENANTDGLPPHQAGDLGNAQLLVQHHRDRLRYVPGEGWFLWD